ncbi:MAG TPA: ABC transporter permease [Chitinophagaceae bacterium]|nr:ABC transporter permease [Chitinophagaceae bacterium]
MDNFNSYIRPPGEFSLGLRELWQYRELFYFFTWRDIKVKYKQTYLGILWAILQPLGMMLIFTFIFSKTLKIQTGTIPYPVFVLSGLLLWGLFSSSVSHAAESMIQNAHIIKKIYFPRLVIPFSAMLVAFFDFLMALFVFIIICAWYKHPIAWNTILFFPSGILLCLLASFGMGTFLAALNIKYRDFRYVVPFLLQVLFFSAQIIYPQQAINQQSLKYVLAINPLNGAIELLRTPLTGLTPDMNVILISSATALLLAAIGLFYFRKTENYFADLA